ncbi:putative pentatricopeptide repeat-containing protein at5g09950 [Phtheirospermum japonicum]|uniref:Putative pentatricopeptide repeat-containing protein at5g09950 n=1 Tax=Phtheirospermum japonicum TaxID=374723 RepID=A0A830B9H4_9LAMI|nr:putative pentatricopeptide repeat-containing protein at5g09950 [Phtheirospermum japonicum]
MGNTLINAYAKNGDVLDAQNVFDKMPERNFVTWACLISGYSKCHSIENARYVFNLMTDKDSVTWSSMISGLDQNEFFEDALMNFLEMKRNGLMPSNFTLISALSSCSSLGWIKMGEQTHCESVKSGLDRDVSVSNTLLSLYGKCGEIDYCETIFSRMGERDEVSWNSMISGYIKSERLVEAMDLVWQMLQNGQRLDNFTFATVLSACASVATLEHGMEVHACAAKAHLVSDVVIGSALVDMYGKCGRIDYASRFFELMPIRNVYSWNSMISGFARHGDGHRALGIFARMRSECQKPDHVTFIGVLSACSHVGLVNQGYEHFESMSKVYSLAPRVEHFSCMVDLLGRAGEFDKLEEFINSMPIEPNILIWRTVLGACGRSNGRMLDLGKRAGKMVMELEPQNAVNYVLLANMYASGGKWEHVAEARRAMKIAACKKEAGCSWVTMKDGIHVFVSGDKSHREADKIHEKLRELYGRMKEMGYVAQIKYALYDVEMENKEEVLSYHSEKLAVAFVLTRESEMPIRIMKNLRVCGDCHAAFKYISEIVGRRIVLRDSNRFHHFEGGRCSCNDYW